MNVIDCNASCGHWPSRPIAHHGVGDVWRGLHDHGVERVFMASLESAWCLDPHAPNHNLLADAGAYHEVSPVPTLDPTLHTWRDHLHHLARTADVRLVRLLPSYGPYDLDEADELCDELRGLGLALQVQTRLDDPRRHHRRALVPDLPAAEIVALARRHPSLTVILGGARFGELHALKDELLELNLLYADTSQCDGMDALKVLCEEGLSDRLLYGSHALLFEVGSGLRRVLDDLDATTAAKILGGTAKRLLWPS